jgi:hypothetical protein
MRVVLAQLFDQLAHVHEALPKASTTKVHDARFLYAPITASSTSGTPTHRLVAGGVSLAKLERSKEAAEAF